LKRQGRTILFSTHILSDAEMLCDRLAVLVGGKLQGIGSPESSVPIEVQGMEVLTELPEGQALPAALASAATRSGNRYRVRVPSAELYATIDMLRGAGASIISLTQVKPTLEDYFVKLVGRGNTAEFAVEVTGR
jgi:ABC-2 type transport system ATP-binding protein